MKIISCFLLPIMLFLVAGLNAQSVKAPCYFVTTAHDTTFCKGMEYKLTGQGDLRKIDYTDMGGKEVTRKGKDELENVVTFYQNKTTTDKTPLKANKPDGYVRFTTRAVDGKLKVYLAQQGYSSNNMAGGGGPSGTYRFFLKMPDGNYYKINSKSDMNEHIKPYLLQCKEFKSQYKGDFNSHEEPVMEMIKLYNSLCK
jgi:hypothetical protein